MKNITPIQTKEFTFVISAHPNASDSVDTGLGEIEIPNLPLPGDQFYVWSVVQTDDQEIWLSPKEIRKLKKGEKHLEIYDVRANWNGGVLELSWRYPVPMYVDSIVVVDGLTVYPNNQLHALVVPGTSITTDNPAFDRFNVMVWYNAPLSDVVENTTGSNFDVWPNPAGSAINLESDLLAGALIQIVDVQGSVVYTNTASDTNARIDLTPFSSGIYAVRLLFANGTAASSLFVHY